MWMRSLCALVLSVAVSGVWAASTPEAYPSKPVKIVDGFPPGGNTDYMARLVASKMQERSGQTVLVDNRPGAGSTIGGELVARAVADGHTMFLTIGGALSSSPLLYPKLPYDIMKDFAYVSLAGMGNYVVLINPSLPVKNIAELVALTKAKPTAFRFATGGVGSGSHLITELLILQTGMKMAHVPYKGGAPAAAATASGEVDLNVNSVTSGVGMIQAKKLAALAVTGPNRIAALPDVPTVAESGFPEYQVRDPIGFVAPARTPAATIKLMNAEIRTILQMDDVKAKFAEQGIEAMGSTPDEYRAIIQREQQQWARVIKAANIPPNL